MDYDQIITMLNNGIQGVVKPNAPPLFPFGFRGGSYLGAPGKDIYFALPHLLDHELETVAQKFASLYPLIPPSNHVKWAAAIRYVYGCFEKQGCLRSKNDKKRMIDENADWSLPIKFMSMVADCFKSSGNKYGLVLHYEMLAHRYGDRSIIDKNNSQKMLQAMEQLYVKSQKLALEINSWKHTFTPFYWAGCYFYEVGDKKKAAKYHLASLQHMEQYCPDARQGYREKAKKSLRQLRDSISKSEYNKLRKWMKSCKNKCLKSVVKYV